MRRLSGSSDKMKFMIEQFTHWDSADYLKTEVDRAEYLDACMEVADRDLRFFVKALDVIARARGRHGFPSDTNDVPERGL